jgi:capsular polysaccharide biosynthesis protein
MALITSDIVLFGVIKDLDLATKWAQRYQSSGRLTPTSILQILRRNIVAVHISGTKFFEITVYDMDSSESARIANALARSYREYRNQAGRNLVTIMDTAIPSTRPVRPNKPKWIALGMLMGAVFGTCVGAAAAWLATGEKPASTGRA